MRKAWLKAGAATYLARAHSWHIGNIDREWKNISGTLLELNTTSSWRFRRDHWKIVEGAALVNLDHLERNIVGSHDGRLANRSNSRLHESVGRRVEIWSADVRRKAMASQKFGGLEEGNRGDESEFHVVPSLDSSSDGVIRVASVCSWGSEVRKVVAMWCDDRCRSLFKYPWLAAPASSRKSIQVQTMTCRALPVHLECWFAIARIEWTMQEGQCMRCFDQTGVQQNARRFSYRILPPVESSSSSTLRRWLHWECTKELAASIGRAWPFQKNNYYFHFKE